MISSSTGPHYLATIGGAVHMAFSDFPSLFPRAMRWSSKMAIDPKHMIDVVVDASIEFLDGKPGTVLSTPAESSYVLIGTIALIVTACRKT